MNSKRIVRISYFTMLTIIGGLIRIEIPFTPINFTLQSLFVIMAGLFLGKYDGAFAQITYMVLGLIGLPVFTKGGGIGYVVQPSFGYILSFPFAAFVTGFLAYRLKTITTFKIFLCGIVGLLVNYTVGITYQVLILTFYMKNGLAAALLTVPSVLIMFIKDAVLVYLICLIYPRVMKLIGANNKKPVNITLGSYSSNTGESEPSSEGQPVPTEKTGKKKPAPLPKPVGMQSPAKDNTIK